MRAGHVAQVGGAVCDPTPSPSHIGGPSMLAQCEHRGPHLFAAKALVPCMLPQGLIGTGAPIRHPTALRTYPSRFESIRVNLSAAQAIRVNPSQSLSVASSRWSHNFPAILVKLTKSIQAILVYSTTAPAIRLSPSQFIIITYYYIL